MKLPTNFAGFLRVDTNKQELFQLITAEIENIPRPAGKSIYSSFKDEVVCPLFVPQIVIL